MAQISYSTITITDTTDIERIYPVYCKGGETNAPSLQPLTNWSENVNQAGGSGNYIWQRIIAKKQGIAVTADDYSDAVRLTGDDGVSLTITSIQYAQTQNENDTPSYGNSMPSPINEGWWLWIKTTYSDGNSVVTKIKQGQKGDAGISVTGTKEIYFLKRTTDNIPTAPADGVTTISTSTAGGIWTTVVPNYIEGGIYYTSIQTTYSSGTSPKSSTAVINQGLTDANQKALDAYNTSIARDTEINAVKAQAKHFWWDSEGAHIAAGENTTSVDNITQGQPDTYTFNALTAPGFLKLKYKDKTFTELTTGSLTFYRPATDGSNYVQGKAAMRLDTDALTFYKPLAYTADDSALTIAARLNNNGLVLSEGGIEAGEKNTSNYIYVYSHDDSTNHTFNINSSGDKFDWRIVAGNNFGVDKAGNLYASNAKISGKIVVGNDSMINGAAASTITSNITKALAIVSIEVLSINWATSNATLSAILKVNENNVSPTTYTWTKNNDTTLPSTDQSISIDDFNATYTCTVEWNDLEGNTLTQSGTLDFKAFVQVYDEASKHADNYLSSEDSKIMIYDGTTNNQQTPSTPLSTTNNVYIDSDTISIRRGNIPLAVFSSAGVSLYTEGKSNPIASYGESTIIGDEQDFHIKISTNGGLEFFNQQDQVAYMDADTLFITNSKISNKLRIGKFIWKIRDENRISFRYEPE